jgi:hypothetical protein
LRPGVTIPGWAPLDLAHGDIHCVFLVLARPIATTVGIPLSTVISPAVCQRLVEQSPFSVLSPLKNSLVEIKYISKMYVLTATTPITGINRTFRNLACIFGTFRTM